MFIHGPLAFQGFKNILSMNFWQKLKGLRRSFLGLLPDLSTYDIEARPQKKRPEVEKKPAAEGTVFSGQEWKTVWDSPGSFTSTQVGAKAPETPELVTLDGYDKAFLDDEIGQTWAKDEARAKVMKWHWLRGESALKIQEFHTANGRLERGYSERSAAQFVKAFYAADLERRKAGQSAQRASNAVPLSTEFEW